VAHGETPIRPGRPRCSARTLKNLKPDPVLVLHLNNARIAEPTRAVTTSDLLFGKYLLLRKGKRTYAVLSCH
jgi:hypothetical protein